MKRASGITSTSAHTRVAHTQAKIMTRSTYVRLVAAILDTPAARP